MAFPEHLFYLLYACPVNWTQLNSNPPTLPLDDWRGQQTELLSVFECGCHPPFQSQRSLKKTVGSLAAHRVCGTRGLRVVRTGSCSHANILMRKFIIDACLQKWQKLSLKPQTFCLFTHCCHSSPSRRQVGCRNCICWLFILVFRSFQYLHAALCALVLRRAIFDFRCAHREAAIINESKLLELTKICKLHRQPQTSRLRNDVEMSFLSLCSTKTWAGLWGTTISMRSDRKSFGLGDYENWGALVLTRSVRRVTHSVRLGSEAAEGIVWALMVQKQRLTAASCLDNCYHHLNWFEMHVYWHLPSSWKLHYPQKNCFSPCQLEVELSLKKIDEFFFEIIFFILLKKFNKRKCRHYERRSCRCWCEACSRVRGQGLGPNSWGANLLVSGCTRTKQNFWTEDLFIETSSSGIRDREKRFAEIVTTYVFAHVCDGKSKVYHHCCYRFAT